MIPLIHPSSIYPQDQNSCNARLREGRLYLSAPEDLAPPPPPPPPGEASPPHPHGTHVPEVFLVPAPMFRLRTVPSSSEPLSASILSKSVSLRLLLMPLHPLRPLGGRWVGSSSSVPSYDMDGARRWGARVCARCVSLRRS